MKLKVVLTLALLVSSTLCFAQDTGVWTFQPGVATRGHKPQTWLLDLRNMAPQEAAVAAKKLSSRLYGKSESQLHAPLVIKTDFSTGKVLAFELNAITRAGSDLVVKTNGTLFHRQVWPPSGSTHRPNRIVHLPLPAGPATVSLEVTQPSGVVVIERYFIADSVQHLPQNPPPLAFNSTALVSARPAPAPAPTLERPFRDDGYRGIWYYNQRTDDEYKFKYSGGLATYPQQHIPIAIYRKEVNKTFFCYGGTIARNAGDPQELLHMVSYFDHATGKVPRPTVLLNKRTTDAHDNPTLTIDDHGHLWIFSTSHGTARPSFIHRSTKPYSIDDFEHVLTTNFSYTQPWHIPGQGFLFLHTRYAEGRNLFWMTSADGMTWNEPQPLAKIERGDYQISWREGRRVATAFDFHPAPRGLNARANIYYLETRDFGRTWTTVDGRALETPVTATNSPALTYDSRAEDRLVFLKDLNFDANGNPVILFLTTKGFEPGPRNDPRIWKTTRWTGQAWEVRDLTTSLNNYDHGSLYIESDGTWRVIAPTEPGPQPYNPGGEMAMWTSADQGKTWRKAKQLTHGSKRNHTYARRPVDAHPEFYAFWADGHAREASESFLYFTNQKGDHVWRLPARMEGQFATPEIAW